MNNIIQLNRDHRNVAVRLSGGPDSAIIYYAICDFYKNDPTANIFPMTSSTQLRPHSSNKAKNVIDIVAKLTGRKPTHHFTTFNANHNINNSADINSIEYVKSQEDLETFVFTTNNIDARYAGLSINCPPDEMAAMVENNSTFDKAACRISLTARDTSRDVQVADTVCRLDTLTLYLPFAKYDKRTVYQMYKYYDVVDQLYPYTWSCESDMQIYSDNPEHCGTCYFCLERIYAFGKL